jgi:hypothetical protein
LDFLENIPLQSLLLNSDRRKNPICNDTQYYRSILKLASKTVDKLTKNDIKSYLKDEYIPKNTITKK